VPDENLEIAKRLYGAFNERDMKAFLEGCDPDIELHSRFTGAVGVKLYRGHEGLGEWSRDLNDVWEYFEVELDSLTQLDDGRVLALGTLHGKGRGSGLELREKIAHISTFRDGRLLELHTYTDRAEALKPLGLSEADMLRNP
jgi:ketosteroid isomerase-like protein